MNGLGWGLLKGRRLGDKAYISWAFGGALDGCFKTDLMLGVDNVSCREEFSAYVIQGVPNGVVELLFAGGLAAEEMVTVGV